MRCRVIGMTEAGININDIACHFDIHKKNCLTNNQSLRAYRVCWRLPETGQTEKKLNPLEERFIHVTSRRKRFLSANPLFLTSTNCLRYARIRRNCQEPSPMHLENGQNFDILSFSKHLIINTALRTNEIKLMVQRCKQD